MKKNNALKKNDHLTSKNYAQLLNHIKNDILQTQLKAAQSVTRELTLLYWRIGKKLSEETQSKKWGAKVGEKLAQDLAASFPEMAGVSFRNLKYMRKFAETYPDYNWATAVAQIPWGIIQYF